MTKLLPLSILLLSYAVIGGIAYANLLSTQNVHGGALSDKAEITYVNNKITQESLRREFADKNIDQRLHNLEKDIEEIKRHAEQINNGITEILGKLSQ